MPRTLRLCLLLACLLATAACESFTRSSRGETCQRTDDCEGELLCIQRTCREAELQIDVLDKQCEQVQCLDDRDCCDDGRCLCNDENRCDYNACTTDADCFRDDHCVERRCVDCMSDDDCAGDRVCVKGGRCSQCEEDGDCGEDRYCERRLCVECRDDDDCGQGEECVEDECLAFECEDDSDCSALTECEDRECVERGCLDDRECQEYRHSPYAACADDGRCEVTCQTDAECVSGYGNLRVCEKGVCQDVGCDSDAQCRARFRLRPESLGRAICR